MKKAFLLLFLSVILISCETNVPYYNDETSGDNGLAWTPGVQTKITIENQSTRYSYQYLVNDKVDAKLAPGESFDMYVEPGEVKVEAVQLNGIPTLGKYEGMAATYSNIFHVNAGHYKQIGVPALAKLRIYNPDSSHRYEVTINGGNLIKPFIVPTSSYQDIILDMSYYHIDAKQLDYIFYPTDFSYDLHMDDNYYIDLK